MTIGQVARESGFAASAIRYYEQAGVLPPPIRRGGRREYNSTVLERLAILERAKACGFSLAETRQLLYGFRESTTPSERWQAMAREKMAELDEFARKIAAIREVLQRQCDCKDLAECGRRILHKRRTRNQ
jgi:MerR family redox-sensitive transcriptional activator SoxR